MKQSIILFSLIFVVLTFDVKSQQQMPINNLDGTLSVLIIGATEEKGSIRKPGIGAFVRTSINQDVSNFQLMAKMMNYKLELDSVTGHDLNPSNVKNAIAKAVSKPKSSNGKSIFILLSHTHGLNAKNAESILPYMLCSSTDRFVTDEAQLISVQDIYEFVKDNGNYDHTHVWAELCNNIPNGFDDIPTGSTTMTMTMKGSTNNIAKLLTSVDSELMTAASYGQEAFIFQDGGSFSNSIFAALDDVNSGKISPVFKGVNGVFENVIEDTEFIVSNRTNGLYTQTPQCFVGNVTSLIPASKNNRNNTNNNTQNHVTLQHGSIDGVISKIYTNTSTEVKLKDKDKDKDKNKNKNKNKDKQKEKNKVKSKKGTGASGAYWE